MRILPSLDPWATNFQWLNSTFADAIGPSGESQDAHEQVYGSGGYDNQAKFSHELIGGAAAFEGMKLFEDHQRKEGLSSPSS